MQQQTLPPKKANRNKYRSPIEQLFADKIDIKEKCKIQEQKINADFIYIRNHAGGLLLSGISSLIFPSKDTHVKSADKLSASTYKNSDKSKNNRFSIFDYPAITKSILPLVWDILQPMAITWGLNKFKSIITKFLLRKK
jgi:hypothetical protein